MTILTFFVQISLVFYCFQIKEFFCCLKQGEGDVEEISSDDEAGSYEEIPSDPDVMNEEGEL